MFRSALSSSAPGKGLGVFGTVAALAAGVLLTLLVYAPAAWLAGAISSATQGRVQLVQVEGTLWNGSASVRLRGDVGSLDAFDLIPKVMWQIRPQWWTLGLAQTRITFSMPCCSEAPSAVHLVIHPWALILGAGSEAYTPVASAQIASLRLPAKALAGLGAPWNTLRPEGQLVIRTPDFQVGYGRNGQWVLLGETEITLRQFATALSTVRPLGDYALRLKNGALTLMTLPVPAAAKAAPGLHATLAPAPTVWPLTLEGTGTLVGTHVQFSGEALAAIGMEGALDNLLHLIGQRQDSLEAMPNGTTPTPSGARSRSRATLELHL